MTIDYVIWNARPQLIDFGSFEIRYYSLLFALGFVTGYIILSRILKKQ
jgi:prolipoprotein diacylglyceryltransferase